VTREELLRALLVERFGPLRDVIKERPRTTKPKVTAERRRVLVGAEGRKG
jgi:hypothetical protein